MDPKVSIILPVFNCEQYISKCLECIINQSYENIEIIVVDDGSTDESARILDEFKREDNRIVCFYQENSGPSEARNKGIANATGEYLVFVDSDDTVEKDYVKCLLTKLINANADLVCCGYKDISEYGVINHTDFNVDGMTSISSLIEMVCRGTGGVLWGKIFKKEIIIKYNLEMDKNIFMSEDLVFVLEYVSHCNSFAAINEYLYNYNRLNQGSISSKISLNYLQNYINVWKRLEKLFNSVNLNEYTTNEIITKRVQNTVIYLIEQQSVSLKVMGIKNTALNIKQILSTEYVKKYLPEFYTSNLLYKPLLFFIKNKFIKNGIFYGIFLNKLRLVKKNLKKEVINQ